MAAYLASVGSDPRAVQQRRPPALGAGQAAAADGRQPAAAGDAAGRDQAKPPAGPGQPRPAEAAAALGQRRDVKPPVCRDGRLRHRRGRPATAAARPVGVARPDTAPERRGPASLAVAAFEE